MIELVQSSHPKQVLAQNWDVHVVSGALKQYFRDQKEPILTFQLYDSSVFDFLFPFAFPLSLNGLNIIIQLSFFFSLYKSFLRFVQLGREDDSSTNPTEVLNALEVFYSLMLISLPFSNSLDSLIKT